MFRKARETAFKMSLKNLSAAPPRRASSSAAAAATAPRTLARLRPLLSLPTSPTQVEGSDWDSVPSLLSTLSKSTASNTLFAGKALLIATALVGIGAFGVVSAVKHCTGAHTVTEFNHLMRYWTDQHFRSITDRIYRGPENEEERSAALETFGVDGDDDGGSHGEEWMWEEAEKRIKRAYEEGGLTLWMQVILRELEAEARRERERRRQEIAAEAAAGSHSSSSLS